jgi:hypothetical protein
MKRKPFLSACVVLIVAAGVAYARVGMMARAAGQAPAFIAGPDHWVPFQADFTDVSRDGTTMMTGKIYRGADGSFRRDGTSIKSVYTVMINNLSLGKNFVLPPGSSTWVVRPLGVTAKEWTAPQRRRADRLQQGDRRQEGLLVLAQVDHPETLEAPELNFYPVTAVLTNGTREVLSRITLGDVPQEVFSPPSDADLTYESTPGGIIKRKPGETGASVPGK